MENIKEFGKYTNWRKRKSFREERNMVIMAVENDDEDAIRRYLEPLARYWAKGYKTNQPQIKLSGDELLETGFIHLELGLNKYYENLKKKRLGSNSALILSGLYGKVLLNM